MASLPRVLAVASQEEEEEDFRLCDWRALVAVLAYHEPHPDDVLHDYQVDEDRNCDLVEDLASHDDVVQGDP